MIKTSIDLFLKLLWGKFNIGVVLIQVVNQSGPEFTTICLVAGFNFPLLQLIQFSCLVSFSWHIFFLTLLSKGTNNLLSSHPSCWGLDFIVFLVLLNFHQTLTRPADHILCLSDVDECEDPGVCGTAQCENKESSYDCLCDIGYIYDNETKSCVGKIGKRSTHNERDTQTTHMISWEVTEEQLQPQQDLMQLCCRVRKGMQRHLKKFCISR